MPHVMKDLTCILKATLICTITLVQQETCDDNESVVWRNASDSIYYLCFWHRRLVYKELLSLLFTIWRFTHAEEIPKGMVKLVFQLQNSLHKDQHLAKVSCQRPMLTVHNKYGSLLFLVCFLLKLELIREKK